MLHHTGADASTSVLLIIFVLQVSALALPWPESQQPEQCSPAQPPLSRTQPIPPAHLLSSVASAGADGPKVLLLPLLPNVVHLPIIIARGLICEHSQSSGAGLRLGFKHSQSSLVIRRGAWGSMLPLSDQRLPEWQGNIRPVHSPPDTLIYSRGVFSWQEQCS